MNFQDLHELLRLELLRRIDRGVLTGSRLAQQAGFQQAHISNFLNKKRALSLEGLDRVLASQKLSIEHILPLDLNANSTPTPPETSDPIEVVPVVSPPAPPPPMTQPCRFPAPPLHHTRARPSTRHAH